MTDGAAASILDDADCERLRSLVRTDGDRESLAVEAPYTGESIGTVPHCTLADVDRAVERAREAQESWAERSVDERAATLRSVADEILAHRAELLDLVQLETGKARFDALEEVLDIVVTADYYGRRGPDFLASTRRTGAIPLLTKTVEHAHPVGVVGLIEPWNYPLTLAVSDALPALLAGNGVVIKPAEATPHTALFVAELLREAGVPEGCVQVVPGVGTSLGPPLIENVDHVSFTGSTETGREVAAQAGRELTPASLELGGKGPMIVREDAPRERTVTGAVRGAFASAGQLCIAVERIFVHESRADNFRDRLVERTRGLDVGTRFDYGPDVGSLVSERQLEKVATQVTEAVDAGATLLTGGRRRPDVGPFVYEPTVLTDVPEDTALARKETFGPVVTVESVPDDEAYAALEPFFDAELRAIAAHVLLPVGRRATTHVLETYTARDVEASPEMETMHGTEVLGSGWLVVPVRDPGEWDDTHARRLIDALDELRSTDYRREADLGRFLGGDGSYYVR